MVQKALYRDCNALGITRNGAHSTRRFFRSHACSDGAREDVIERVTHNARGTMVDQYTWFGWEVLYEAVACLEMPPLTQPSLPRSLPANEVARGCCGRCEK